MQNIKDIKDIFKKMKIFENIFGLKVNPEKTQIIASNEYLKNKIKEKYPLFKITRLYIIFKNIWSQILFIAKWKQKKLDRIAPKNKSNYPQT